MVTLVSIHIPTHQVVMEDKTLCQMFVLPCCSELRIIFDKLFVVTISLKEDESQNASNSGKCRVVL